MCTQQSDCPSLALTQANDAEATDAKQRRAPGADKQELSWLMRTTYISNEDRAKKQQQQGQAEQYSDLLTDELKAIEASSASELQFVSACTAVCWQSTIMTEMMVLQDGFAAAQLPPRHPSKPEMKALEILPSMLRFCWAALQTGSHCRH